MTPDDVPHTRGVPRSVRRTLITGASRPLGIELVRQALMRGDRVYAAARNPARVPVLADLRAEYGGLELIALDPADAASVADAIPVLESLTDSLDALILGPAEPGPHDKVSELQRDEHLDTLSGTGLVEHYRRHAVAPLLLVRTLLPLLARYEGARVLLVSGAIGSITGKSEGGSYATAASAAAFHMLSRTLAHDLAEQRITVCIGNPGHVGSDDTHESHIPIDEAAAGLLSVMEHCTPERSGAFIDWTGSEREW